MIMDIPSRATKAGLGILSRQVGKISAIWRSDLCYSLQRVRQMDLIAEYGHYFRPPPCYADIIFSLVFRSLTYLMFGHPCLMCAVPRSPLPNNWRLAMASRSKILHIRLPYRRENHALVLVNEDGRITVRTLICLRAWRGWGSQRNMWQTAPQKK
jgi:hypothetical protein